MITRHNHSDYGLRLSQVQKRRWETVVSGNTDGQYKND